MQLADLNAILKYQNDNMAAVAGGVEEMLENVHSADLEMNKSHLAALHDVRKDIDTALQLSLRQIEEMKAAVTNRFNDCLAAMDALIGYQESVIEKQEKA